MVESSMCALGNLSVEAKTHKGLKENEKAYLSSALQTRTSNRETFFTIGTGTSIRIFWGLLKRRQLLYKKKFIELIELMVYLGFDSRNLSRLEAGQALAQLQSPHLLMTGRNSLKICLFNKMTCSHLFRFTKEFVC